MKIQNRNVKIYDAGDKINDRYTIVMDGSVYGMSANPFAWGAVDLYLGEHGFAHGDGYVWNRSWGKKVKEISELPENLIKAINYRINAEN